MYTTTVVGSRLKHGKDGGTNNNDMQEVDLVLDGDNTENELGTDKDTIMEGS